jgi:ABC-type protease/lipase transport system fused ATPase/permease subunit
MIGEMYMGKKDFAFITKEISYVPQKVWLRNQSVRENVCEFKNSAARD